MPRQFAFFLPQFHSIRENDEWWGKGFTEWNNVKKAKPLYKGHVQPKLPENDYYYNLLDKKTVEWQTKLMSKYHIDGMIYYHYYFKGKLLLEKPAENLLKWKEIDQPFFFCWANHSWYRSWEGSKTILVEQEYGSEEDWERHFQYLLPFFRDSRYEKKDGKPVFMVFESAFPEKEKMFSYFSRRCQESGFKGICIIETWKEYNGEDALDIFWNKVSTQTEYVFEREPGFSRAMYLRSIKHKPERYMKALIRRLKRITRSKKPEIYDGNKLYRQKINKDVSSEKVIHGVFFEWDNTPRHGSRGYVITPVSRENYLQYMNKVKKESYIFINAWNEWAEGMMLEPTKCNGDHYLQWIAEGAKADDYQLN